ncbi:MAG: guanylate kinase [Tahibacter sp.]
MPGTLYIVAAPSGAGKSSLVNALLEREPGIGLSISHTTRQPRPNDRDGVHYHFVKRAEFEMLAQRGEFLEHAEVFGNFYGTSRAAVCARLDAGHDVLLEIDWQGAQQIRAKLDGISIFILPPSREELLRRLRSRGSDSESAIARRTAEARLEMAHCGEFDYIIVNDDFATALSELRAIITSRRLQRDNQLQRYGALLADLLKGD